MDEKITNIKERILQIAEFKGISKEKFIESLNQKYANYKGISKNSSPSSDVMVEIISKYPDVNIEWLLTGKGQMLKNQPEKPKENNSDKEIIEIQKQLLKSQNEQIELLKEKIANLQRDKRSSTELHK